MKTTDTRPAANANQPTDARFRLVIHKLLVDRLTVEITRTFEDEGIQALVLKGPALAAWLYPDVIRPYADSDLMVAPQDREKAGNILKRLGFRPWRFSALSADPGSTDFRRNDDMVDLHYTLPGLLGDSDAIWSALLANSDRQIIAGAELRVPDRDTLLLHIGLHAARDAGRTQSMHLDDLRRAIDTVDDLRWKRALALARAYDGVPAFATGLRMLPEGRDLAHRLGLDDIHSPRYNLRRENDVIAEELSALFTPGASLNHKLATIAHELIPHRDYMRKWSPLARRGQPGLVAAYLWRMLWALGRLPGAVHTLWRFRQTVEAD